MNASAWASGESIVDLALLEYCVREDLNQSAPRVMGVLHPLRVVIDNYPEDQVEQLDAPYHPEDGSMGSRALPFSRVIYIERDDFMEAPPKKFFRLAPGREVRLRYAYYITCTRAVHDPVTGEVVELHCTYDPATRGGWSGDGRKVKATLHWVSAAHALKAEVRLYDRQFDAPNPAGGKGRGGLHGPPQPRLVGNPPRLPPGTQPGNSRSRRPLSVRTPRVFLRRYPGFTAGGAGIQPHGDPARHLGQDRPEATLTTLRAHAKTT